MMCGALHPTVAAVIELEQRLLERDARLDRTASRTCCTKISVSSGRLGRVYDRAGVIEVLLASDGGSGLFRRTRTHTAKEIRRL